MVKNNKRWLAVLACLLAMNQIHASSANDDMDKQQARRAPGIYTQDGKDIRDSEETLRFYSKVNPPEKGNNHLPDREPKTGPINRSLGCGFLDALFGNTVHYE